MDLKKNFGKLILAVLAVIYISSINVFAVPAGIPVISTPTATTTTITVAWSLVTGATNYDIEADGIIINTGTSRTFTDIGLNSGTGHNYRVRARDASGAGSWSAIRSVFTIPEIPAGITTVPTSTTIKISWAGVPGATGYDLSRDGTIIDNATSTTYTHTRLTAGTQHNYMVRAKNTSGVGSWSALKTLYTLPGVPTGITTTATSTSITVNWGAVTSATGYDIEVDGAIIDTGTNRVYTHTKLGTNSQHSYRIRAKNTSGTGAWSGITSTYTMLGFPSGIVTSATSVSIIITWSGVTGATGYDLERDGTVLNVGTEITYSHTALIANSQHNYRVRSKNANGAGDWSGVTTQYTMPGIPTSITATATSTAITLNWTAVTGATGYDVEADGAVLDNSDALTYTQIGLNSASQHSYRIRAKNSKGAGDWSAITKKYTLPDALFTTISTAATTTSINISWSSITGATGYDIERDGTVLSTGTAVTYTHTGLTSGSLHNYRIRAKNTSGVGEWSALTAAYTLPAIPAGITSSATSTTITLKWTAAIGATGYDIETDGIVFDNDSNITYTETVLLPGSAHTYRVRAKNTSGVGAWSAVISKSTTPDIPATITITPATTSILISWSAVTGATGYDIERDGLVTNTGTNRTYTNTGLTAGSQHKYRVRAKNTSGAGDWNSLSTVYTLPGIPAGITTIAGSTAITITWVAATGATGYDIETDGVVSDNGASITYKQTGLASGSAHSYRIRAKNSSGVGAWSAVINKTTAPGIPANITTLATTTSITTNWATVTGATGYDIERDGTIVSNGTGITHTHTGLTAGSQHNYRVRARSTNGNGDWSTLVTFYTLPNVPTGITSSATISTIIISWDKTAGATGYDVERDGVAFSNDVSTTYTHVGLSAGSLHNYKIRAKTPSGVGAWSQIITIKTLAEAPEIPQIEKQSVTQVIIKLNWNMVPGAESYDVEVDGFLVQGYASTKFIDEELEPNTLYTYRIRSRNAYGVSEWSQPYLITTLPGFLAIPGNIKLVTITRTSVTVTWNEVEGANGYDIEVDDVEADCGSSGTYTQNGLSSNSPHYLRIRAKALGLIGKWSKFFDFTTLK